MKHREDFKPIYFEGMFDNVNQTRGFPRNLYITKHYPKNSDAWYVCGMAFMGSAIDYDSKKYHKLSIKYLKRYLQLESYSESENVVM